MSQKKVDSYKEQKANRKQTIKKEKTMLRVEKLIGVLVAVVIVAWVGFSVYGKVVDRQENQLKETEVNTAALDNYMSSFAAAEESSDEEAIAEDVTEDAEEVTEEADAEAEETDAATEEVTEEDADAKTEE